MARNNPGFALIALGANLDSHVGAPGQTLKAALARFADHDLVIRAVSPFRNTPAFPAGAGPDYVNAAARVETDLEPQEVLGRLHQIEATFGRARIQRWGQRTLDLDLIAYDHLVLPNAQIHADWRLMAFEAQKARTPDQLILPHPRMQDRAFVLVPLADVAPDWRHPVLGITVVAMRDALPAEQLAEVRLAETQPE